MTHFRVESWDGGTQFDSSQILLGFPITAKYKKKLSWTTLLTTAFREEGCLLFRGEFYNPNEKKF